MLEQTISFASRGFEGDHPASSAYPARGEQCIQSMMSADIENGHSALDGAFNKATLSFLETVIEHGPSAEVISGEPPSDFGHVERNGRPGEVTQPAEKHGIALFRRGLSQKLEKPIEQVQVLIRIGDKQRGPHLAERDCIIEAIQGH